MVVDTEILYIKSKTRQNKLLARFIIMTLREIATFSYLFSIFKLIFFHIF